MQTNTHLENLLNALFTYAFSKVYELRTVTAVPVPLKRTHATKSLVVRVAASTAQLQLHHSVF